VEPASIYIPCGCPSVPSWTIINWVDSPTLGWLVGCSVPPLVLPSVRPSPSAGSSLSLPPARRRRRGRCPAPRINNTGQVRSVTQPSSPLLFRCCSWRGCRLLPPTAGISVWEFRRGFLFAGL
jgi:hypothetical protein